METNTPDKPNETGLQATTADNTPAVVSQASVIEQNGSTLIEICLESINKIKEDASYIPQAEAISNQVKQIIDIAKTQIDGIRVSNSFNRR